ncbi:MAG: alkaline phosphatase D family protein [Actinomycetota bacterium]|nr:alkaline phosphatase D family protein [Actinomycetota bacterium]
MSSATRDPDRLDVFAHGVASGDPLGERVVIWTRVTTAEPDAQVRWTVARDEGLDDVVATGRTVTDGERDFTVKIDVDGLRPATTYFYAFEALGAGSPVGRTRTAAWGPTEHLRLAFTSCAKFVDGYFNVYARMAEREVDLVVHLGDYFYEYGQDERSPGPSIGRAHIPSHPCKTLDDYRTRYALHRLDDDCRRLHQRHPIVHVFDDHEFADNRWREGAGKHDPEVDGPWERRAADALRAWYEWLPVRMTDPDDPARIYRRLPLGDLVDLVMIDCRSYRDRQVGPPVMHDVGRQLLGGAQHDWLCARLSRSTAVWRLVGNQIMIGQAYTDLLPEWLGPPLAELGILSDERHGAEPDQWDGYPAARSRLFSHIRSGGIRDVVFLSGDVHTSWALHLLEDPTSDVEPLAVEFVTPSVTSQNLNEKVGDEQRTRGGDVEAAVMERNPHVRWCEFDDHGYVLLDVTRERVKAEWWHVDTVLEPSEGEALKAAWELRAGTSRLYDAQPGEQTGR